MESISKRLCAIYTRKSSDDGLEQSFNSLDAQREACAAYINSQKHEGWEAVPTAYDDGGYSGGSIERPGLQQLLQDIEAGKINIIVVYKIDRLTRSLIDFAKMVELFDRHKVTFVSITQQFNTTTSMGRLTLNVLLSFAQFEREVAGERIRDKIAASKAKGIWMGGYIPVGYECQDRKLSPKADDAQMVKFIFNRYLELGSVLKLQEDLKGQGIRIPATMTKRGKFKDARSYNMNSLYNLLKNPIYIGQIKHRDKVYLGQHQPIIEKSIWNKVQNLLNQNYVNNEHSLKAQSPSLLAGKIFDIDGNYFASVHGNKNKRRYHYYINKNLKYKEVVAVNGIRRLPSQELDDLVESEFLKLLSTVSISKNFNRLDIDRLRLLIKESNELLKNWSNLNLNARHLKIRCSLVKVIVSPNEVTLNWDRQHFLNVVMDLNEMLQPLISSQNIKVIIPLKLVQIKQRNKLIVGDINHEKSLSPALIADVCKAYVWNQELVQRKYATVKELAADQGKDHTYVSAMLRFAWLAPDIVESILCGVVPPTFTVRTIRKLKSSNWQIQRSNIKNTTT